MPDLRRAVFRHKRKAIAFFVGVVTLVTLVTLASPKTYQSEGKLLLRLGRENAALDPTASLSSDTIVNVPYKRENELNSLVEMLKSRLLMERVVRKVGIAGILGKEDGLRPLDNASTGAGAGVVQVPGAGRSGAEDGAKGLREMPGPDWPPRDFEKAVATLTDGFRVEPVSKSNVVRITYRDRSPEMCQAVVAALIDSYLDEHARLSRPEGTHHFLAEETAQLQAELTEREEALRRLKDDTGLASPAQQEAILVKRIGELEGELLGVNRQLASAEARVQSIREALSSTPKVRMSSVTEGFGNEGTDGIRERLYALRLTEAQFKARYQDAHPKLREIREQVAQAQALLEKEQPERTQTTTSLNAAYQAGELALLEEERKVSALRVGAGTLRNQLAQTRADLNVLNEAGLRIARAQREVDLYDGRYRKYVASLENARIDQALGSARMSNVRVAQPATLERVPVGPRVLLNLILGVVAGGFGAVGLALLLEYRDDSLQTPEDIERQLRLPTLIEVPRMQGAWLAHNGRK